jgi:hypothetical protein
VKREHVRQDGGLGNEWIRKRRKKEKETGWKENLNVAAAARTLLH